MTKCPEATFGTIGGRYYAMDRDKRWERVEPAYKAMVSAQGPLAASALQTIEASYNRDKTDEFVTPTVIEGYPGMRDGDGLIMANFRSDRARQILQALILPQFNGFARQHVVAFATKLGMAEYSSELAAVLPALFPKDDFPHMLGDVIATAGLRQLRIAETEKYAHVTFFFNGGREDPFAGEDRILIPSPSVPTYDLKPEMSAFEVTEALIQAIQQHRYDLIVVNYANTDMVGHTGNLAAAQKAVEAVDLCLSRLGNAVTEAGGTMLVTADHGNAEQMWDATSNLPHTAHTCNLVPVVLVNPPVAIKALDSGALSDVAPTILELMGLTQPQAMTGRSLIKRV
jgi:2,3-bisphosphoglycerate-independent phosphoglycerate mutase